MSEQQEQIRRIVTSLVECRDMEKEFTLDRMINESVSTPLLLTEITGGSVAYVNPPLCELTGYTEEEIYRMAGTDLLPDSETEWFKKVIEAVLAGEERQMQTELHNKFHTRVPVKLRMKTLTQKGRVYILAEVVR